MRYGALPVEYDNSLSYYEQLCKILKEVEALKDSIGGDISAVVEQWLNENWEKLAISASYDSNTETINLGGTVDV